MGSSSSSSSSLAFCVTRDPALNPTQKFLILNLNLNLFCGLGLVVPVKQRRAAAGCVTRRKDAAFNGGGDLEALAEWAKWAAAAKWAASLLDLDSLAKLGDLAVAKRAASL